MSDEYHVIVMDRDSLEPLWPSRLEKFFAVAVLVLGLLWWWYECHQWKVRRDTQQSISREVEW